MELDLEIGDVILAGKFKNKRKIVKDIGKDSLGQPTINGMKALNFRIEKLMSKDKWSKESKEALEFAKDVNEMKVTKRQLKRIIKEEKTRLLNEVSMTNTDILMDIQRWVEEIRELHTASGIGNLEVAELGGPDDNQAEMLESALGDVMEIFEELEYTLQTKSLRR